MKVNDAKSGQFIK